MDTQDAIGLAGFVVACMAAASSGAFFRPGVWYERLSKPSWTPPNWLFGPAWTLLFAGIAASGWLVWKQVGFLNGGAAMAAYVVQLLLNAAWSGLFFGMRRLDLAFAELVVFWIAIAANIALFAPISTLAAGLLVPYLAWVTFAGALNLTIWQMNRVPA